MRVGWFFVRRCLSLCNARGPLLVFVGDSTLMVRMARTTNADHELMAEATYNMVTAFMLLKKQAPHVRYHRGCEKRFLGSKYLSCCSPVVFSLLFAA